MDRSKDFYVYLNSANSNFEFPDNTNYAFTNSLCPNITLTDEYEVGLVNILFSPEFYTIKKGDPNYSIELFIDFTKDRYFRKILNLKYTPQKNINSATIPELIENIDKDFQSYLNSKSIRYTNKTPIIQYNSSTLYVDVKDIKLDENIYPNSRVTWNIGSAMAELLGIQENYNTNDVKVENKAKYPKSCDSLLIYSDIIFPSSFSNQNVHLLDIVPMNGVYSKNGSLTIYKKVNRNNIDDISISIKNENGENAYFCEHVKVLIILHFRRL